MAGSDLRVSLKLTAEDLLNPVLVEALSKLQLLQQATDKLNGTAAAASAGPKQLAAAEQEATHQATQLSSALGVATGVANRFGSEFIGGMARIAGSLIGFEAAMHVFEGVKEAAVELEQANRRLGARFGESAGEFREFSEQAARGTNFTAVAFEGASAVLQPLMRDYGLTAEQLKQLEVVTADLAAANSVDLVSASNMVAATMRGQTRAGAELGLNLRTNVIDSMQGLSDAERKAVADGDTLGGAQARLHVIFLEAKSAQGQAAQAAAETGDSFARLDGASKRLFETLANSGFVQGLTGDLATASESANNLLRIYALLQQAERERLVADAAAQTPPTRDAPGGSAYWIPFTQAFAMHNAYIRQQQAVAAAVAGMHPDQWGMGDHWSTRSGGVPPGDTRTTDAQLALAEQGLRAANARALAEQRSGERAEGQAAATKAAEDYGTAVQRALDTANAALKAHGHNLLDVAGRWNELVGLAHTYATGRESQLESVARELREDRARRARLGLPALAGETDMIRALGRAETAQQQNIGTSALAWAAALLKGDDPLGLGKVSVNRQDVTAQTVIVNGLPTGSGQSALSGGAAGRYAGARSDGPAYRAGLGRFGQ